MKKLYFIIIITLLFFFNFASSFELTTKETNAVDEVVSIFQKNIDSNGKNYKQALVNELEKLLNSQEVGTKNYEIVSSLKKKVESIKIVYNRNNDISILVLSPDFSQNQISELLQQNGQELKNYDNIFIFRRDGDISLENMAYTNEMIISTNEKMRIFVDQEGGQVNRYDVFDENYTFKHYLQSDDLLNSKYSKLTQKSRELFENTIKNKTTFISAKKVGEIFSQVEDKENFLDFVSYFQLFTHKIAGINTFGLVVDLNYGNPAISDYERSFSASKEDYILYGQYFVTNALELEMSLYLKHFPGHGDGKIDTHLGILEYTSKSNDYINKNLEVFEAIIGESSKNDLEIGVLVGHIILPNDYKERFDFVLKKVDYILTDDLSMQAYKQLQNQVYKDKFFTTNEVLDNSKTIKIETAINQIQ